MRRQSLFILGAAVLIVLFLALFVLREVHYFDSNPAIAVGNEYFSKLRRDQLGDALAMYSEEFQRQHGEDWRKLLVELQRRYGAVNGFKLLETKIVPLEKIACVAVDYQVTRNTLSTEEKLTICPDQPNFRNTIAGHAMVRLDTGQQVATGITFREQDIFRIGAVKPPGVEARVPEALRAAAAEFYNRMSTGQLDAIYESSGDDFKASATQDRLLSFLKDANRKTGACQAATLVQMTSTPSEDADIVYLYYTRNCANGTILDGTSWKVQSGKALLANYFLSSPSAGDLPLIHADEQVSTLSLKKATDSAEGFYRKISARQFDTALARTGEQLKAPPSQDVLLTLLKQMDEKAGPCGIPALNDSSYLTSTAGMYVVLSYTRKCANGEVSDRSTWKIVNGEALLDGYYVTNPEKWGLR